MRDLMLPLLALLLGVDMLSSFAGELSPGEETAKKEMEQHFPDCIGADGETE